jgi:hypothetical protein
LIRIFLVLLALLAVARPAHAEQDVCAAGASTRVASGGHGILFGTSAWAEGGACVNLPLSRLVAATSQTDALTFNGVTRILSVDREKLSGAEMARTTITYQAYHDNLGCRSATWPVLWTTTLLEGTPTDPQRVSITGERVPGGDANGAYLKRISIRAEFQAAAPNRTAVRVRYEVDAPFQSPGDAADSVRNFIGRLVLAARGERLPGAVEDPACPYAAKPASPR